jgi:hypothetical protein
MFIFAGLTIIPGLLQLRVNLSNGVPVFQINLTHHPSELQSTHEFQLGENISICTGCFGSFLSIIVAEVIFSAYFLFPNLYSEKFSILYIIISLFLILISYSRYIVVLRPDVRMGQHMALFIGITLGIIGCDLIFQSAFSMILLLPSWILFLFIRVRLSDLDHKN